MPQRKMMKKQIKTRAAYAGSAHKNGAKAQQTAAKALTGSKPVTIRLEATDLQRAKKQAERKGLRYQTYIKSLLHEGLMRDAGSRQRA